MAVTIASRGRNARGIFRFPEGFDLNMTRLRADHEMGRVAPSPRGLAAARNVDMECPIMSGTHGAARRISREKHATRAPGLTVVAAPVAAMPKRGGDAVRRDRRRIGDAGILITAEDLSRVNTKSGLIALLRERNVKIKGVLQVLQYDEQLEALQVELVKLQRWVQSNGRRIAIILEGRDAAGKGGTIRRFIEHLNPRAMRVVALPKPTEEERGQWYFQRYSKQLPNQGEVVFFDRSWYNRAVVEPVNGFCTQAEYERFMQQVPEFEHMLYEDGVDIIKFWFSISREEQLARFDARRSNPLKQWKLSPIDDRAQELWDTYTQYKEQMFSRTHTSFSPWVIVRANNKKLARLESIRYVLSLFEYEGKSEATTMLYPDPTVVMRFHRKIVKID
jgi:polyphosphate kinase